jgi:hypothetical protein
VTYDVAQESLDRFSAARAIRPEDAFFVVRRPNDLRIKGFQFVKAAPLSGTVSLLVNSSDLPFVVENIGNDPMYFEPEYSITSETYLSREKTWEVEFVESFIKAEIDGRSIAEIVDACDSYVRKTSAIPNNDIVSAIDKFLGKYVRLMHKETKNDEAPIWLGRVKPAKTYLVEKYMVMQKNDRILSESERTRLVFMWE